LLIVLLAIFGTAAFLRAKENIEAEFKPDKKLKVINQYETAENSPPYESPYIYLCFYVVNDTQFSNWSLNETLESLMWSQNYFEDNISITYIDSARNIRDEELPIEEANVFYLEDSLSSKGFYGYFRLKPANPNSDIYFEFHVPINIQRLTMNWKREVDGLWISIAREMVPHYWGELVEVPIGDMIGVSAVYANINYHEEVTRTWTNENVHYIFSTLEHYEVDTVDTNNWRDAGWVEITLRPSMMIEYWGEYVDYDYYDWLAGMGGMISIASTVFFWGAYHLSMRFGDKNTMGILPGMSMIFENFENIHLLMKRERRVQLQ